MVCCYAKGTEISLASYGVLNVAAEFPSFLPTHTACPPNTKMIKIYIILTNAYCRFTVVQRAHGA